MRFTILSLLLVLTGCVAPKTMPVTEVSPSATPAATADGKPEASGLPAPSPTPPASADGKREASGLPTPPAAQSPDASGSREPQPLDQSREAARAASDPLYEAAKAFDRYVHAKLEAARISELKSRCRHDEGKRNPFCFTLRRSKSFGRFLAEKSYLHEEAPPPPPIVPIPVVYVGKRIKNWRELRRGKVPELLKGLLGAPLAELHDIAKRALAERLCPNNIAVATAATLEDSLPDSQLLDEISQLYEKGAVCAVRQPVDREHFRTRAGLLQYWRGDYAAAAALFARVRPTDAYSGRAIYWLYKSKKALGDQRGADVALKRLLLRHPFSFHALVAELAEGMDPGSRMLGDGPPLKKLSKRSKAFNKLIEQAEILKRYGFAESAAAIAEWGARGPWRAEPEARIYLATLGDSHSRVTGLPQILLRRGSLINRRTMEELFPTPFREVCERFATSVDPYLILSLARKESAFDPKAISNANAQGLLQLNPKTAALLTNGVPANLLDPQTNIALAAKYLSGLLSQLGGELPLVIAAYNAGDEPVATWKKRLPVGDAILFIDLIPYRETRDYVGYVLANYYWYRRIYQNGTPDVFKQLVTVKTGSWF